MADGTDFVDHGEGDRWYDLFSRGARDWLRHNEKVRETVRKKLPELLSNADVLGGSGQSNVKVPVKFLEHYRFKLVDTGEGDGAGQGDAKPGDVLGKTRQERGDQKGEGGNDQGEGYQFVLELKVDDIVEWLWEELKLPNLETKTGGVRDEDYVREGWNRRGVRSRLDRRRSVKEAIKRRAIQTDGPAFTDDDLRFRQLVVRQQPTTEAVVFFAMDVSSSMTEHDRRLAKTFFFWVIQGLKRQYTRIEPVFVAHTVEAWEFEEEQFFQVQGAGGTVASTAFEQCLEITKERYDPTRFNVYLFYASDGANFRHDREAATDSLAKIGEFASFMGYVETVPGGQQSLSSETSQIFEDVIGEEGLGACYGLSSPESVWDAIRAFFSSQAPVEQ